MVVKWLNRQITKSGAKVVKKLHVCKKKVRNSRFFTEYRTQTAALTA